MHQAQILIADSAPDSLHWLVQALQKAGYGVQAVADGALALLVAQINSPELILLDADLPVLGGLETCQRLKCDCTTRNIPVIFLGKSEKVEDKVQALAVGGVDYIARPFQLEEVLARIQTHLSLYRSRVRLEQANAALAARLAELTSAQAAEREQRILAETLRDTIAAINSTLDVEEILSLIFARLGQVSPHDVACIALLDEKGGVQIKHLRGYHELGLESPIFALRQSTAGFPGWRRVMENQQPVIVEDTLLSRDWLRIPEAAWIRSYLCVPIMTQGKVIGFLELGSTTPAFFSPFQAERLQTFADQVAVAIEKARVFHEMKRLAVIDELTGVYNRRHLFELLERELERARRYRHPLSIILFDVDRFKQVNDAYGHQAGDQVLRCIAQICQDRIRKVDILGRYGGEEFIVVMPETDHERALDAAERIRQQVEQLAVLAGSERLSSTFQGQRIIQVTISLGVATTPWKAARNMAGTGEDLTLEALIRFADEALHTAKLNGRNRVCGRDPGADSPLPVHHKAGIATAKTIPVRSIPV